MLKQNKLTYINNKKMSLQFITDSDGKTTGVFIPINEWNKLKNKYKDIDQSVDWYDELTPEQKKEIEKARVELDAGKGIPHEEVMKSIRQKIENKRTAQ